MIAMQMGKENLAKRVKLEPLEWADVVCPICLDVLVKPVKLPCDHFLCLECYELNNDVTSFHCPVCRRWLSNWARVAARNNAEVDQDMWKRIQTQFADRIREKLRTPKRNGMNLSCSSSGISEIIHVRLAQPGEVYQEYLAQIGKSNPMMLRSSMKTEPREEGHSPDAAPIQHVVPPATPSGRRASPNLTNLGPNVPPQRGHKRKAREISRDREETDGDEVLAQTLGKLFKVEEYLGRMEIRIKGSDNEYFLRKRNAHPNEHPDFLYR